MAAAVAWFLVSGTWLEWAGTIRWWLPAPPGALVIGAAAAIVNFFFDAGSTV